MDDQYIDASPYTVSEASNKFKSHAQKRDVYHYMHRPACFCQNG